MAKNIVGSIGAPGISLILGFAGFAAGSNAMGVGFVALGVILFLISIWMGGSGNS